MTRLAKFRAALLSAAFDESREEHQIKILYRKFSTLKSLDARSLCRCTGCGGQDLCLDPLLRKFAWAPARFAQLPSLAAALLAV